MLALPWFFEILYIQSSFAVGGSYQDKQLKYIIKYFSNLPLKLFAEIGS